MATGTMSTNPTPAPAGNGFDSSSYLEKVLPGFGNLSAGASGVIGNLLKGLPDPNTTRNANATFGVNSGLGTGSDFLRGRGYDLFNQQGEARQQQGLGDLLSTIQTYSGNVTPNAPQLMQNSQFGAQLGEQSNEFNQNFGLQKFQAMLQALGLGNSITNSGQVPVPQMTL